MTASCVFTAEQKAIVSAVQKGHSIFYTGFAGTGKSFVLKHLIKTLSNEGLYATSGTGISAIALGEKTLHSFAGIGNSSAFDHVLINRALNNKSAKNRIEQAKVLIIDEISMISMRLFDLISYICVLIKKVDYPFGGIQIIALGDYFQLAPVRSSYEEGKYSFLSVNWQTLFPSFHCFFLTKIFRQGNIEDIELLNEVREDKLSEKSIKRLESMTTQVVVSGPGEQVPHLNSKVIGSFIFNCEKLHENALSDDIIIIKSVDSGDLSSSHLDQLLHVQHALTLKVGCPVMMLCNKDDTLKNGSRGTVISFLHRYHVISFEDGTVRHLSQLSMLLWTVNCKSKTGQRLQLPLMLCYAFTIHKSQGLPLSAGELNVDHLFSPGQGYTGLPRFSDLKRVRLVNYKGAALILSVKMLFIVCILYLIYCNYYHIYPITFFLHISPSLFCHDTTFISYSLHVHLYHLTVFFSFPSASMALLSFSFSFSFSSCCFFPCWFV